MNKVPFVDLSETNRVIRDTVLTGWNELIDRSQFVGGPMIAQFEEAFAAYSGVPNVIGCANGTDALTMSLRALDIGPGDTVLVPANTFIATSEAVTSVGASVRFTDVDYDTRLLTPEIVEKQLQDGPLPKAIIIVHLYGLMADVESICKVAERYGVDVVEDAAQAHGATANNRGPGYHSSVATYSFYPGKNLGAFGDAGAVVTRNNDLAERVRRLRNHGRASEKYEHTIEGYNSRLDPVQSTVLLAKLPYLDEWTRTRRERASRYIELLSDCANVVLPVVPANCEPVWHLFVVQVEQRDAFRKLLGDHGIATGVHYPIALHLQPAYSRLGYTIGDFPVAEHLSETCVSLPMWSHMTDEQVRYVCAAIREIL